jgi:hypothetical protein
MKSTALVVLVALFMVSDFGVSAMDTRNAQSLDALAEHKKKVKETKKKASSKSKNVKKQKKAEAKKEDKKEK